MFQPTSPLLPGDLQPFDGMDEDRRSHFVGVTRASARGGGRLYLIWLFPWAGDCLAYVFITLDIYCMKNRCRSERQRNDAQRLGRLQRLGLFTGSSLSLVWFGGPTCT